MSTITRNGDALTFTTRITKEKGSQLHKDVEVTIDFSGESIQALQNRLCNASSPRVAIQNALRLAWKSRDVEPPSKYEAHISKLTETTRELSIEDLVRELVAKGVPEQAARNLIQQSQDNQE